MPPIQRLLQRWGFVKLGSYGLELNADGRIASNRAILDDGTGARIVGWQDNDPAIAELTPWQAAEAARSKPVEPVSKPAEPVSKPAKLAEGSRPDHGKRTEASPVARAATKLSESTPTVVVAPAVSAAPASAAPVSAAVSSPAPAASATPPSALPPAGPAALAAPPPAEPSAADMVDEMALGAPVDEDDWEWTIALAKARAADFDAPTGQAAPAPASPSLPVAAPEPLPSVIVELQPSVASRVTGPTRVAAQRLTKIPTVPDDAIALAAAQLPHISSPAPSSAATAIPATTSPVPASPATASPAQRGTTPSTVIPVPSLPTIETMHGRLAPVVRTTPPRTGPRVPPASMARFAKGTGPVEADAPSEAPVVEPRKPEPKPKELPLAARIVALPNLRARVTRR